MKKACKSCRYTVPISEQSSQVYCARYPAWIEVQKHHYCFEFKAPPKKKVEPAEEPKESYVLSRQHRACNLFTDIFSEIFGRPPYISVKDKAAAKRLAHHYDFPTLEKMFRSFLTEPPQWNRENNRYDLRFVQSAANILVARLKGDGQ